VGNHPNRPATTVQDRSSRKSAAALRQQPATDPRSPK